MAKDFNDFVYKLENDELAKSEMESIIKEVERSMATKHSPEAKDALRLALVKDFVLIHLRAYHEWVNTDC